MKKFLTVFLIAFMLGLTPVPLASADVVIIPTDDTYVDENDMANPKDGGSLIVDYSFRPTCKTTRVAYLRFDLSSLTIDVGASATVSLYVIFPPEAPDTLAIWSTTDGWTEETLTWNTPRPDLIAELATAAVTTDNNVWVNFNSPNLVSYINSQRVANSGDGVASFGIIWKACTVESNGMIFEDKDPVEGTLYHPRIIPMNPTAVAVSGLDAVANPGYNLVTWNTSPGLDILGCNLWRAETLDGTKSVINGQDIILPEDGLGGSIYSYLDDAVAPGQTYFYWVEPLVLYGTEPISGPVWVTSPYVIYMPVVRE
jgi:hypothetical protein